MSNFPYWITVVTTSKQHGNALAAIVGPEPGDATSFNIAPGLRLIGDNGVAVAWWQSTYASAASHALAAEYASAGPYPLLNARGVTDQQIAAFKQYVTLETGERAEVIANTDAFLANLGYEPVQRAQ